MKHLKGIYFALKQRMEQLLRDDHREIIVELRLDIEQIIQLLCTEKGIPYDGLDLESLMNSLSDKENIKNSNRKRSDLVDLLWGDDKGDKK